MTRVWLSRTSAGMAATSAFDLFLTASLVQILPSIFGKKTGGMDLSRHASSNMYEGSTIGMHEFAMKPITVVTAMPASSGGDILFPRMLVVRH